MSNWWKELALASRVRDTARVKANEAQEIAIQHAVNETARFVGVVLARETDGARESSAWHAFPMKTAAQLEAWFDDWVGTPSLYFFLWAFDKESDAWTQGAGSRVATPDGHGGRVEIVNVGATPAPALTLPELTHAMIDQDYRWAGIVDKAKRARHPIAPVALRFFKIQWEPMLRSYMTRIESLNPALAPRAIDAVLARMHAIYTMARAIGFPESSFLLPDITLDYEQHPEIS